MRVSRAQAEENRQNVIDVASRLFREHGFDGIGLKDLMEGAGMTQGAFYKQFASKEDLVAQASARALEYGTRRWSDAAAANPDDPLGAVIAFYLTQGHREAKMEGCPLVALGADAARQSAERESVVRIRDQGASPRPLPADPQSRQRREAREGHGHPLDDGWGRYTVARGQRPAPRAILPGCGSRKRSRIRLFVRARAL